MKKNKGYSLLEVLVAFTILTVAMIPILSMYPMMFRMSHSAGDNEELARLSLSVVDYIKSRGYDNLTDNTDVMDQTKTYTLTAVNGGGYTSTDGNSDNEPDFEDDFNIPTGFFLLSSKESKLEGATIEITLESAWFIIKDTTTDSALSYYNPVSGETSATGEFNLEILTTTDERATNEFINGEVTMTSADGTNSYNTTFVISPIENW